MGAGKFDRRLTIRRWTATGSDALNQPILGWVDVATVWAQQRPIRTEERFEAQQEIGSEVMTFQIRYRRDLSVRDRVVYAGREYEVTGVRELGRRAVSEFDAVARVDENGGVP